MAQHLFSVHIDGAAEDLCKFRTEREERKTRRSAGLEIDQEIDVAACWVKVRANGRAVHADAADALLRAEASEPRGIELNRVPIHCT